MFPIMLDLSKMPVFVVGDGRSRIDDLVGHDAAPIIWFVLAAGTAPEGVLRLARWPTIDDFNTYRPRLVFINDDVGDAAPAIAAMARDSGALVHLHDQTTACDFHLPARLRRGRLLLTVSTDGAVAGLSRLMRDHLAEHVIPSDWAARVEHLAERRRDWKASGLHAGDLFKAIAHFVRARGWLSPPRSA